MLRYIGTPRSTVSASCVLSSETCEYENIHPPVDPARGRPQTEPPPTSALALGHRDFPPPLAAQHPVRGIALQVAGEAAPVPTDFSHPRSARFSRIRFGRESKVDGTATEVVGFWGHGQGWRGLLVCFALPAIRSAQPNAATSSDRHVENTLHLARGPQGHV